MQEVIIKIASLKNLELLNIFLNKNLYSDLNQLVCLLILKDIKELYEDCLDNYPNSLKYYDICLACVKSSNLELLKTLIEKLNQGEINDLLINSNDNDLAIQVYLVSKGAKFEKRNYQAQNDKINNLINHLLNREDK